MQTLILWVDGPLDWNGEDDMPRHLWHRQVAILTGLSLDETRVRFEGEEPQKVLNDLQNLQNKGDL